MYILENIFLEGPPKESDWWIDGKVENSNFERSYDQCDQPPSDEASLSVAAKSCDAIYSTPVVENDDIVDIDERLTDVVKRQSSLETDMVADNNILEEKKFHNCGLTGWLRVREAWLQPDIDNVESGTNGETAEENIVRSRRGVPPSLKKDLVKCLQDRRQFELSRSIPLKDMIEAYCEAWEAESDEKQL